MAHTNESPSDKIVVGGLEHQITSDENLKGEVVEDDGEVFKSNTGHAEFRALGW